MHVSNLFAMLDVSVFTMRLATVTIIAAVAQWLAGALWYGVIFKKSWRNLVGFSDGEKPKNRIFAMIAAFVACLLLSYVLAQAMSLVGPKDFINGSKFAIFCWLGFMAPLLVAQHVFENRRANLLAINACYWLLAMGLAGGLVGAFH